MFCSGFQADGPASIAQALGVLAAIIAVHEFGHFSAARLQGIHVTQFAIGFGPPLIAFKVRRQQQQQGEGSCSQPDSS
jgi:membrane-associated protease RseP (regulator of RpoE activity)